MKHLKLFEEFDDEEAWWEEEQIVQKECDHELKLKSELIYEPHNFKRIYFYQCSKCGKRKEIESKK